MKQKFSKNTTEVFTKTLFHYVPKIRKYIDEIDDPRKRSDYSMRYLIISEMLMFLSEGKSQRFTETAYKDTNYFENIGKIIKEDVKKVPDAEIYTDVFSRIKKEKIEDFHYKINYHMIRNKTYEDTKVFGKYNMLLDATRFQKSHYQISEEWLNEEKDGKTTWYLSILDLKLAGNNLAIPIMNEMIKNEDKKKEGETDEEVEKKSEAQIKQDCEVNAAKRLIPNFRKRYPRLPVRFVADSLYPAESLIDLCEKEKIEYIFVMKDKKIPTLFKEFLSLASLPDAERKIEEDEEKIIFTLWVNDIDYRGKKVSVIRQITRRKNIDEDGDKDSVWMWITNREVTKNNVEKIIRCAKLRDYIENQGFREQKVTSGIDLKHVYSKNINAIQVIYTIIQITHTILQLIEHSDICGDYKKEYGSTKVFRRRFYADLTKDTVRIEIIEIKIQIRLDKSSMIY